MRVLQIGRDDWSAALAPPEEVEWRFVDAGDPGAFDPALIGRAEVTILDASCPAGPLEALDGLIAPYTLIVAWPLRETLGAEHQHFLTRKAAAFEDLDDRRAVMDRLPFRFFARPFGQKLEVRAAQAAPRHRGPVRYDGTTALVLDVDQGDGFRQLVMWKENIPYENRHPLELWLEYVRDAGCELELQVQLVQSGSPEAVVFHRAYSEAELAEPIVFAHPVSGYLSVALFARGRGQVRVGPLHYRHSRLGAGHFLPGGRRIVDDRREELFTYFHPGDLTPPLNVYFSGYRRAEGFEGSYMMAGLGHPFLLVTDPRLEGGRFYLGSDELEGKLLAVIREHIDALGFADEDVIFSGLSMGSFGALYYGSRFRAHAILAGKPIIDLARVAARARLERPKDFLTILDVVNFWSRPGAAGAPETAGEFTRRLVAGWGGSPGFGDTRILMSYMQQDDYDDAAYVTLLASQTGKPTTVIARGYQGRHNDDSASIVTWFVNQYRRVIDEYRERRHGA